jgi:hypothetical protein
MVRLEERLGSYELSPAVAARDAREAERRAAGIAERVERLRAQPEIVIDRLAEPRSVWNGADIEREVRSALGVRSGHDAQIAAASRAVAGASLAIDTDAYSTARVVREERAVFAAAGTLADRKRTVELRAPDVGLDAQQRTAYARLAGKPDLAIVTGIAGAEKSRLQRDVAAAYAEAGFRVIGTAVAGDAARTLGEEAAIDTRTVARLLVDLNTDRDRLDSRTVLMIDEAGTLGAAQARGLLERARDAGTRVMLLGDTSQHESVGRAACCAGWSRNTVRWTWGRRGGQVRNGYVVWRPICEPGWCRARSTCYATRVRCGSLGPTTRRARRWCDRGRMRCALVRARCWWPRATTTCAR